MQQSAIDLHCGYFGTAFAQHQLVKSALDHLGGENLSRYDLLVGTGVSGAIAVPLIAYVLNKRFCIVRKQNDGSHSGGRVEGQIASADRWLFVDDIICTGSTRTRAIGVMDTLYMGLQHVGDYCYHEGSFADEADYKKGRRGFTRWLDKREAA